MRLSRLLLAISLPVSAISTSAFGAEKWVRFADASKIRCSTTFRSPTDLSLNVKIMYGELNVFELAGTYGRTDTNLIEKNCRLALAQAAPEHKAVYMNEDGDMKPEDGFFARETFMPAESVKILNFVLSAPQVSDEVRSGYACYKWAAQGKDAGQVVGQRSLNSIPDSLNSDTAPMYRKTTFAAGLTCLVLINKGANDAWWGMGGQRLDGCYCSGDLKVQR